MLRRELEELLGREMSWEEGIEKAGRLGSRAFARCLLGLGLVGERGPGDGWKKRKKQKGRREKNEGAEEDG